MDGEDGWGAVELDALLGVASGVARLAVVRVLPREGLGARGGVEHRRQGGRARHQLQREALEGLARVADGPARGAGDAGPERAAEELAHGAALAPQIPLESVQETRQELVRVLLTTHAIRRHHRRERPEELVRLHRRASGRERATEEEEDRRQSLRNALDVRWQGQFERGKGGEGEQGERS